MNTWCIIIHRKPRDFYLFCLSKMCMKKIGSLIREKRENLKLSQHRLGVESDLDIKYIGKIERGEVNVSVQKLRSIVKVFKMSMSDFFSEIGY